MSPRPLLILALLAVPLASPAFADEPPLTDKRPTVESAIATPATDLNIRKTPIPDVLQKAVTNPYDLGGLDVRIGAGAPLADCQAIARELASLDDALGPDADEPKEDARDPKEAAAAAVLKTGVEAVIPFRGVIRMLTGANAYEREIQAAVNAGFARRGFLKGRAMQMNCAPPASPSWFRPAKPQTARTPADYLAPAAPPLREAITVAPAPTEPTRP